MSRKPSNNIMTIISNNVVGNSGNSSNLNGDSTREGIIGGLLSRRQESMLAAKTERVHKIQRVEFNNNSNNNNSSGGNNISNMNNVSNVSNTISNVSNKSRGIGGKEL